MAICLIILVLISFAASSASEKSIFLLAGQSNMAGRGGTYNLAKKWDGITPPECQSDPNILRLNNEMLWEAHEPLHQNKTFSTCSKNSQPIGIGPGMAFANFLLKRDPAFGTIGLVPCAVGNTGIIQWSKGSCLYTRLLARARASLRDGGALRALLWYQGENDVVNDDNAIHYKSRLEAFFTDVQSDLMAPSLPIIQLVSETRLRFLESCCRDGICNFRMEMLRSANKSTCWHNN